MNPGDLVTPNFRSTPTGLPVTMGLCKLLKPMGTVPNFWKVERLDPSCRGKIVLCFVYPEDMQKPVQVEEDKPKPALTVVYAKVRGLEQEHLKRREAAYCPRENCGHARTSHSSRKGRCRHFGCECQEWMEP